MRERNAGRPAADVFAEVYERGLWGGAGFHSGSGSRGHAAEAYVSFVRDLIGIRGVRSVVDVGCGDFHVAAGIIDYVDSYCGLDIVPEVIARNRKTYDRPGIGFAVHDATRENLPPADLCLVRQVLQHLSNGQVARILANCERYPLVLVTEHHPSPAAAGIANLDKPHGPDTRLDRGSWVDLLQPPFGLRDVNEVLSVGVDRPLYHEGETIRTFLWQPQRREGAWPA